MTYLRTDPGHPPRFAFISSRGSGPKRSAFRRPLMTLVCRLFQDTGVRPVSRRPIFAETARGYGSRSAPVLEQLTLAVAGFVVFVTGMIAVAAHHETATLSSHCCRNKKPQG